MQIFGFHLSQKKLEKSYTPLPGVGHYINIILQYDQISTLIEEFDEQIVSAWQNEDSWNEPHTCDGENGRDFMGVALGEVSRVLANSLAGVPNVELKEESNDTSPFKEP